MITAYSITESLLTQQQGESFPLWLDVHCPTAEDCSFLQGRYGIPVDFTQAALDRNERPRVEREDGVVLILVRASQGEEPHRHLPFATCPLAVIVTEGVLVTVCEKSGLAHDLLSHKLRAGIRYHPARLALSLFMRVSAMYMEHLHQMDESTERIERSLGKSMQNSELVRMLHIEKSLIFLLTSLKGNHAVLEKLQKDRILDLNDGDGEALEDVLIESRQATEMAEVFSQLLGSFGDAFGNMVSNNLNKAMKFLTAMTIVLLIPSIIAALYGMNVALPMAKEPYAFFGLCGLCIVLSGTLWMWFRKQDWM